MKATLLIKNIHKLYPADGQEPVLEDAWIACFHDTIVARGRKNDYLPWLDLDLTRVVDATGETVIPVFTDPGFHARAKEPVHRRLLKSEEGYLSSNGILNAATPFLQECSSTPFGRLVKKENIRPDRLVGVDSCLRDLPEDWLMTTQCENDACRSYSLQPVMSRLYFEKNVNPLTLLEKACHASALAAGLSHCGSLEVGKEASFLVLSVQDFRDYLTIFGRPLIHRVIFKGIPVYPSVVRC